MAGHLVAPERPRELPGKLKAAALLPFVSPSCQKGPFKECWISERALLDRSALPGGVVSGKLSENVCDAGNTCNCGNLIMSLVPAGKAAYSGSAFADARPS